MRGESISSTVDLLLLLGSGISRDAGMPMVDQITSQVLSGDGVFRAENQIYYIDADNPNYQRLRSKASDAIAFVKALEPRVTDYYGRKATYEELASMIGQISDAISFEYDNAALHPLVESLLAEGEWENGYEVGRAAEDAHDYIRDSIWHLLDVPSSVEHLSWLADTCKRYGADVVTLNHDLVIEHVFETFDVTHSDGFQDRHGDLAFWSDDFGNAQVRFLKLHGSISWWGQMIPEEEWRGYVTARSLGGDAYHPRDATGAFGGYPHDLRPIMLTGTFDKILAYETWVLPDQHFRFHEALRRASRVIVVGYGFGDKAINTRLIGWLARSLNNVLIVAHGKPNDLREAARPAIRSSWRRWQEAGRLRIIDKWADELDSTMIDAALA